MNIIYTPSALLKEVKFRNENLPVVIRVKEFTEKSAEEFSRAVARAQNTGQPVLPIIIDSYLRHSAFPAPSRNDCARKGDVMWCHSV